MYILLQLVGEWLLEVAVGEIGCKLSNFLKKLLKKCGVDRKFTLNANFVFALFRVGVFHANHRQHLNLLLTKAVCSTPCSFL